MENTVKQRLMEFCKATGIRPAHLEQKCGFSHGYINSLKDRPSTEKAERILSAYPQLNRVWLLSGEGSMLNDGTTVTGGLLLVAASYTPLLRDKMRFDGRGIVFDIPTKKPRWTTTEAKNTENAPQR